MAEPHDRSGAPDTGASSRRRPRGRRRADTRDPRRSRERALKILFQADIRGEAADDLLGRIVDDPRAWVLLDELDPEEATGELPTTDLSELELGDANAARRRKQLELDGFTRSLVQGVAAHQDELDELVQRFARRWTVSRMPAIDRNLLRLGSYELAHESTSPAVVINEIIELAKRLSTEDSGRYVNGVLESVRKHLADHPRPAATAVPDDAPVATPAVEVEPVVPDTAEAPPFEPVAEPVSEPVPEPVPEPVAQPAAPSEPPEVAAPATLAPEDAEPEPVEEISAEGDLEPVERISAVTEDVLPPPDEEGDAIDLVAEPTPEEPDEPETEPGDEAFADDPAATELDDVEAADEDPSAGGSSDGGADGASDGGADGASDEPGPGAGQQQLF